MAAAKGKAEDQAREVRRIITLLHRWGIHTLGAFAALKQEDVAARLGPEGVGLWQRASGKSTRVLKLVRPSEIFEEFFEFEHEIETIEPLLFVLRRFLEQLSLRLGTIYQVIGELELELQFSDKSDYRHLFKIPEPTTSVEVLFRMLHTHLENFRTEFPIVAVALLAKPVRASQQQFGLFETALRDPAQLAETLTRLTGLLGHARVGTPVLLDTYRPDAFEMKPFVWNMERTTESLSNSPPGVALRRFRSPMAAAASILVEGGKPAHLRSTMVEGAVEQEQGPYYSSGDWWDQQQWARREWDLQLKDGTLCRCHQAQVGWAVDGIYD